MRGIAGLNPADVHEHTGFEWSEWLNGVIVKFRPIQKRSCSLDSETSSFFPNLKSDNNTLKAAEMQTHTDIKH